MSPYSFVIALPALIYQRFDHAMQKLTPVHLLTEAYGYVTGTSPGTMSLSAPSGASLQNSPRCALDIQYPTYLLACWYINSWHAALAHQAAWQIDTSHLRECFSLHRAWYPLKLAANLRQQQLQSAQQRPSGAWQGFDPSKVPEAYGDTLTFWDWKEHKIVQQIKLGGDGLIPLETRFLHDPSQAHGYVGAALSSNVIHFTKVRASLLLFKLPDIHAIYCRDLSCIVHALRDFVISCTQTLQQVLCMAESRNPRSFHDYAAPAHQQDAFY